MSSSVSTVRRILDGRSVGWSILTHLMLAVICLILSSYSICDSRTSPQLKVQLPHGGILVGRHLLTHKGRHMKAFMGIPYAKPPLGKLRFKVCPKKWIKCTNCIGLRIDNVRLLWSSDRQDQTVHRLISLNTHFIKISKDFFEIAH